MHEIPHTIAPTPPRMLSSWWRLSTRGAMAENNQALASPVVIDSGDVDALQRILRGQAKRVFSGTQAHRAQARWVCAQKKPLSRAIVHLLLRRCDASVVQVAALTGLSKPTITGLKHGRQAPQDKTFSRLLAWYAYLTPAGWVSS